MPDLEYTALKIMAEYSVLDDQFELGGYYLDGDDVIVGDDIHLDLRDNADY